MFTDLLYTECTESGAETPSHATSVWFMELSILTRTSTLCRNDVSLRTSFKDTLSIAFVHFLHHCHICIFRIASIFSDQCNSLSPPTRFLDCSLRTRVTSEDNGIRTNMRHVLSHSFTFEKISPRAKKHHQLERTMMKDQYSSRRDTSGRRETMLSSGNFLSLHSSLCAWTFHPLWGVQRRILSLLFLSPSLSARSACST